MVSELNTNRGGGDCRKTEKALIRDERGASWRVLNHRIPRTKPCGSRAAVDHEIPRVALEELCLPDDREKWRGSLTECCIGFQYGCQ